jgi:large subunit ribosomal protein L30
MKLAITQRRSAIGRSQKQRDTVVALGLKHLNQTVVHEDNPQIRGMIKKISHLLAVEELAS